MRAREDGLSIRPSGLVEMWSFGASGISSWNLLYYTHDTLYSMLMLGDCRPSCEQTRTFTVVGSVVYAAGLCDCALRGNTITYLTCSQW